MLHNCAFGSLELVTSDRYCFVPGKQLFQLSHTASTLVPAFQVANLTHFFHHCLHPRDLFAKYCVAADRLDPPPRAAPRSDSFICQIVEVPVCEQHLQSEPCADGCTEYSKISQVYQCNPNNSFYYHEHWFSHSIQAISTPLDHD